MTLNVVLIIERRKKKRERKKCRSRRWTLDLIMVRQVNSTEMKRKSESEK